MEAEGLHPEPVVGRDANGPVVAPQGRREVLHDGGIRQHVIQGQTQDNRARGGSTDRNPDQILTLDNQKPLNVLIPHWQTEDQVVTPWDIGRAGIPLESAPRFGWRGRPEAPRPKPRADQGQAPAIPQEVSDLLCTIKEDKRELSVRMVIEAARASGKVPADMELAPATVHRLLSRQGLMAKRPEEPTSKTVGTSPSRRRTSCG